MMSDEFIESIIKPKHKQDDSDMVYRQFDGLEAVAQFEKEYHADTGGEN